MRCRGPVGQRHCNFQGRRRQWVAVTWSYTEIRGIRFHDLRHTHATLLMKQGVNPKVVQERLGHSNMSVTLDIYSHVVPGMQEFAAMQLDEALKENVSPPV